MRIFMAVFCLLASIAFVVIGDALCAMGKAHHYSQWRELVSRGAIVRDPIAPQHENDPTTEDGAYDVEARVLAVVEVALSALPVSWLAAAALSFNALMWVASGQLASQRK